MNQVEKMFEHAGWLQKSMGHYAPHALALNKESPVTKSDFIDSNRTGQCSTLVYKNGITVGAHHVPEGLEDQKFRYFKSGSNKTFFLLEWTDRNSTAPLTLAEKMQFEADGIWRGGVRLSGNLLIVTSGFHPLIDEAVSLHEGLVMGNFNDKKAQTKWIQEKAMLFQNPFAVTLSSMSGYADVSVEEAVQWGDNNIVLPEWYR